MAGVPRVGGKKPPKIDRTGAGKAGAVREQIMSEFWDTLPPVEPTKGMSAATAQKVLEYVSAGGTIARFARLAGMPVSTVRVYMLNHYRDELDQARKTGADAIAEFVLAVVTTPVETQETTEMTNARGQRSTIVKRYDNVYARKLAAWGCLELLKSWSPERYGNKLAVDATGSFAAAITAAKARIAEANEEQKKSRRSSRAAPSSDAP